MEKEAFLRLPEAKRELLLKKGKEAYVRYPFEDITIRFLTGELGIDLTTFYRYFESRDDLLIYAYRDLIGRTRYEDYALVYRFVNVYDDALDNDFFAACMRIGNGHREIRDRLLQVEQDILIPSSAASCGRKSTPAGCGGTWTRTWRPISSPPSPSTCSTTSTSAASPTRCCRPT